MGIPRSARTQQRCCLYYCERNRRWCNKDVSLSTTAFCVMQCMLLRAFVSVVSLLRLPYVWDVGNTYFLESVTTCSSISQMYSKLNISLFSAVFFLHSCDGSTSSQLRSFWFCSKMLYKSYKRSGDEWQQEIRAMNLGGSGKKSSYYNLRFCDQSSPRMMTKALQTFEIL